MPFRTSKLYAYMAEADGKVVSLDDKGIIVEYKDGKRVGVALGISYGKAEGSVYPHSVISLLKLNEKFNKDDTIAYNEGFFEPDFYNPKRVVWKSGMTVKTALYESTQTHEDSSSISRHISNALSAKTTKVKSYTVEFKQNIRNVIKPGANILPNDVLFLIEDESTSSTDVFDDKTIDTLKKISSNAPRAKYKGTVERIEVFYHGDKDDMSPTLKQLANFSDRILKERCESVGDSIINGEVNSDYRVGGDPLLLDTAEIKVYITLNTTAGIGDKGVFANQMKSVFGEVIDYDIRTKSGEVIDSVFGYTSIAARIVLSPVVIGTTTSLLKLIAKQAIDIYEGK